MSPDRIAELRRQRALVQEHLAWIDGEIAKETGVTAFSSTSETNAAAPITSDAKMPVAGAAPAITAPATTAGSEDVDALADAAMAEYRVSPDALQNDVRKGCFLYFAAAFALLAVVVAVLWFALRHGS
jgi:hypothetical protein